MCVSVAFQRSSRPSEKTLPACQAAFLIYQIRSTCGQMRLIPGTQGGSPLFGGWQTAICRAKYSMESRGLARRLGHSNALVASMGYGCFGLGVFLAGLAYLLRFLAFFIQGNMTRRRISLVGPCGSEQAINICLDGRMRPFAALDAPPSTVANSGRSSLVVPRHRSPPRCSAGYSTIWLTFRVAPTIIQPNGCATD